MRERGFGVWMDTEMMSGSTLDAMAAAVEDAYCVLICITERYKARPLPRALRLYERSAEVWGRDLQASANCRLEGTCEYPPCRCAMRTSAESTLSSADSLLRLTDR